MQAHGHARHRGQDSQRLAGQHWQRTRFQMRAPVGGLAGPGAWAIQLGRQTALGTHHEGRRQLSADLADPGRPSGGGGQQEQDRPIEPLGTKRGRAARVLESGGGGGGQERAHGLGDAQQGPSVQAADLNRKTAESWNVTSSWCEAALMSQGWTCAGSARLTSEGAMWRPWLTNGAPARVFHQGQQESPATKAVCSLAVLILAAINAVIA